MPVAARCGLAAGTFALAIGLAGCSGSTAPSASAPSTPPSASPAESSARVDLVIPDPSPGEVARVVFLAVGPDGDPSTTITIPAAAVAGTRYVIDGQCSPLAGSVPIAFSVAAAGDEDRQLAGGAVTCDGGALETDTVIDAEGPVEISFSATDGVWQAYARLVPAD